MESKLIGIIVSVAVSVIVIASIMIPAFDITGEQLKRTTYTNDLGFVEFGQYYDSDATMIVDATGAATVADVTITVNDEVIGMRDSWNRHVIADSDNMVFEINTTSSTTTMSYLYGYDSNDTYVTKSFLIDSVVTIDYDHDLKTITVESGEDTYTFDANYFFSVSNKHDYGYINSSSTFPDVAVSSKSMDDKTAGILSIFSTNITTSEGTLPIVIISDISGTRVIYDPSSYTGTVTGELSFNGLSLISGYSDIYSGGSPEFTVTYDGTSTDTFTPARSFVMIEMEGHLSSTPQTSLLGVIPLIVIISVLIMVVSMVITRRE